MEFVVLGNGVSEEETELVKKSEGLERQMDGFCHY